MVEVTTSGAVPVATVDVIDPLTLILVPVAAPIFGVNNIGELLITTFPVPVIGFDTIFLLASVNNACDAVDVERTGTSVNVLTPAIVCAVVKSTKFCVLLPVPPFDTGKIPVIFDAETVAIFASVTFASNIFEVVIFPSAIFEVVIFPSAIFEVVIFASKTLFVVTALSAIVNTVEPVTSPVWVAFDINPLYKLFGALSPVFIPDRFPTALFASIAFVIAPLAIDVAFPTLVTTPVKFAFVEFAAITNAVVAKAVVLSPAVWVTPIVPVGKLGVPEKIGEAKFAFNTKLVVTSEVFAFVANAGTVGNAAVPPKSPVNCILPFVDALASSVAPLTVAST